MNTTHIKYGLLGIVSLILVLFSARCVPVGHEGVLKHLGKVSHDRVLSEGLHFVIPLVTMVKSINIKLLKYEKETTASSQDLQDVMTQITIQYSLRNVSKLYQNVGTETQIERVIMVPAVEESVKAITANYTAEELITKRSETKIKIEKLIVDFLKITLKDKGIGEDSIRVSNVAITNFKFSEGFNKSIEMKVEAEQRALQAKNEKLKKITDAEATAEKIRLESIAKANAIKREAKALRENPLLIEFRRLEKWNGVLPSVTGGAIPMFNINKIPDMKNGGNN